MADNLQNRGEPDRSRINLNEPHEVKYWTQRLGVSADELRAAVAAAGTQVEAVEARLKQAQA